MIYLQGILQPSKRVYQYLSCSTPSKAFLLENFCLAWKSQSPSGLSRLNPISTNSSEWTLGKPFSSCPYQKRVLHGLTCSETLRDGRRDGWADGWVDGWMNEWMGGDGWTWMNGWTDAWSPWPETLLPAWPVMFQLYVGRAAVSQLLIFGHQECPAPREKNKCGLALRSQPRLKPSPSISSGIKATFKEKHLFFCHLGPQVNLRGCRRYVETTLEHPDQDGDLILPACCP